MGDASGSSADSDSDGGPVDHSRPVVVGCMRRHGFDYGEFPAYSIVFILLTFAAQVALDSSGTACAAIPFLASIALLLWLLVRRFTRPTRVTANTRSGTVTFENCCFRRGYWHVTRPSLVRMPVAEIDGVVLRSRRFSIGFIGNYVVTSWRLTVRTARGTVRLGSGMRNVQQLGETLKRMLPPAHCKSCGYDLRGNVSGRCPECGMAIAR